MTRIPTKYPHFFNADGTRRLEPCSGFLEIICDANETYACCSECGEGYKFQFVMRGSNELGGIDTEPT